MDIEPIARPSRFVRALIHWRLVSFVTVVVLFAAVVAMAVMAGSMGTCGCEVPSEDDNTTIETEFFAKATASAAIPTPVPSAAAAPAGGLLWPKPVRR
jgi:hypothetical protein